MLLRMHTLRRALGTDIGEGENRSVPHELQRLFRRCRTFLVDITPGPALAGFERNHYGVTGLMMMSCRVTIRRAVAATDVPALEAQPQVNPRAAGFEALLASRCAGSDGMGMLDVFAGHDSLA